MDKDINVHRLSDKDAQELLREILGKHLKESKDLKRVARLIIKECNGMPHTIMLIENSLANVNNPAIWQDILIQLRLPSIDPK